MNYEEMYKSKVMTAKEALELIKDKDYIFSAQAAAEPIEIMSNLTHLKNTGVKGAHLNTCLPLRDYPYFHDQEMKGILDHNAWFMSGALRKAYEEKLVSPVPQSSTSILRKTLQRCKYENWRPVVICTVSPMDKRGYMTLSVSAIYERDLINNGAFTIVEVNPNFPRTYGDTLVHISEVEAIVEANHPIPISNLVPYTEKDAVIGKYIADLIDDGSTIQLGIGNIPNAVANELKTKKHLGVHTEMFTETMVDLIKCGAVDNSLKTIDRGYSVCSFTMGSQNLYDFLDNNPSVIFKSCTYTNDPYTIGKLDNFVSINATLEVDLYGQAASETVNGMPWSGTGGQSETVMGAQRSKGGKSILAMHSTYSTKDKNGNEVLHSKIVPYLAKNSAVSTSRNDTDYIVTEYGVAWLRGLNIGQRANELIKIAHPDFREELTRQAEKYKIW
ncbi:acetyl-CoA hydrolase/transferase family protein [Peptoniphilus porci]|uniref:Acetyl-CoA hydrolase n=1 Tax=Peptoniphilus porci TaxID=2652280 RepID=A0A1U7M0M7_9FIRM|nr:acetyl-CoA hydrolase/transferase C-terminal domain-containing protein [Peptoniphilus porci]OLR65106.1 acetyl-CoA hydrolase [Peptoniphilus porci]